MEGKDIIALRKKLYMTQAEFAVLMKVEEITIGRWERCECRPRAKAKRKLNRLMGGI